MQQYSNLQFFSGQYKVIMNGKFFSVQCRPSSFSGPLRRQAINGRVRPCIPYKVKVFIFVHNRNEVLFYIPAVTQDDDIFSVSELRHYLADHRCSQFQFGFLFLPHTVSRRYGKIVNFAFVPLGGIKPAKHAGGAKPSDRFK